MHDILGKGGSASRIFKELETPRRPQNIVNQSHLNVALVEMAAQNS